MCTFHYFNYYLPHFVTAICLGFLFGFSFGGICFNLTYCHNKPLVESSFLTRDQKLSLWSGNTDSKTLDYQRTNPRDYQIVRSHMQKIHLNTRPNHHPTTSSTLCRMPHLNNKNTTKQKYKPNHQQTGLPPHSTLPIRGKTTKQTKPQHKSHPIQSLHKHWTNLRRAETRKKKEFNLEAWEKETSNTIS